MANKDADDSDDSDGVLTFIKDNPGKLVQSAIVLGISGLSFKAYHLPPEVWYDALPRLGLLAITGGVLYMFKRIGSDFPYSNATFKMCRYGFPFGVYGIMVYTFLSSNRMIFCEKVIGTGMVTAAAVILGILWQCDSTDYKDPNQPTTQPPIKEITPITSSDSNDRTDVIGGTDQSADVTGESNPDC